MYYLGRIDPSTTQNDSIPVAMPVRWNEKKNHSWKNYFPSGILEAWGDAYTRLFSNLTPRHCIGWQRLEPL